MQTTENVLSHNEVMTLINAADRQSGAEHFARIVESAVLDKLRRHDIEDMIDRAYLNFTAMRDGRAEFASELWSEQAAFKAHMRRFAYARYHEMIGEVMREMRREGAQA